MSADEPQPKGISLNKIQLLADFEMVFNSYFAQFVDESEQGMTEVFTRFYEEFLSQDEQNVISFFIFLLTTASAWKNSYLEVKGFSKEAMKNYVMDESLVNMIWREDPSSYPQD